MWTEDSLLDTAYAYLGRAQPVYLLRQVEVLDRRIDAVLVVNGRRLGIEVKTNRADFRRESDAKREPTERTMHGCVYLCPPGVIEVHELPDGWGLWYAIAPARLRVMKHHAARTPDSVASSLYATALTARAAAVERRVRAAERAEDPAAAIVAVDGEVRRLEGLLAARDAAVARERARAQDAAEQVLALVGEQTCSCCEQPIIYTRVGAWRHVDRTNDTVCEARRAEAERLRRKALTGAEYAAVQAPRITPRGVPTDH